MMGVSMALAFEKLRRKNIPRGGLAVKAFRRAATLFALGLFLYAYRKCSSFYSTLISTHIFVIFDILIYFLYFYLYILKKHLKRG